MATVKEEFAKMGIYDGEILINPSYTIILVPTLLDTKKEKTEHKDHYDRRREV